MIRGNTIDISHHPLHIDSVSAHGASHHGWASGSPLSKFRAVFIASNLFEIQWKK